eukprot:gene2140-4172_t
MSLGNDGSIGETKIPRPNIITPSEGTKSAIEKFLMMYTCKKCEGRNAQMVAKVAYNYVSGMVISTCKHCKVKHLIADNQGKLDMPEYGKKIEDYLTAKGEVVQKVAIRGEDLEDNYLVDCDGVVSLVPKIAGQPSPDVNIIDLKPPKAPSRGFGSQFQRSGLRWQLTYTLTIALALMTKAEAANLVPVETKPLPTAHVYKLLKVEITIFVSHEYMWKIFFTGTKQSVLRIETQVGYGIKQLSKEEPRELNLRLTSKSGEPCSYENSDHPTAVSPAP